MAIRARPPEWELVLHARCSRFMDQAGRGGHQAVGGTTDRRFAARARALATSLLVATIAMLVLATPALAKMPYLTVELDATAPVQGEPVRLTVRLFEDAQHTVSTDWPDRALAGLLAMMPADGVATEARSLPVQLTKIGPGTYSGSVIIDRPGRWIVRAFPDRTGWATTDLSAGYPSDIVLEVRSLATDLGFVPLVLGAILTAAGGLVVARRRSALDPQIRPAT